MPVPTWLSSDPVEPKLPARVRPGWAPRPNKRVKLVGGWEVPEGAGQEDAYAPYLPSVEESLGRIGSWASPQVRQTRGALLEPAPPAVTDISPPQPVPPSRAPQPVPQQPLEQPTIQPAQRVFPSRATAITPPPPVDTSATDTTEPELTAATVGAPSGLEGPMPKEPGDLIDQTRQAAIAAGIDPDIFARQIQQESGFKPDAKSPAGALGIAQFMPGTAKGLGIDPMNPQQALTGAARLMKEYLNDYGGDYRLALAAYNAGPGNVAKYGGVPPFEETQNYVAIIYGSGGTRMAARQGGGSVLDVAQSAVGSKYQYGGPGGRTALGPTLAPTDCSGFVSWAYQQGSGIQLPAQTEGIWQATTAIDPSQARPGDLVMYNMQTPDPKLQHVGIYLGNGQMIHDSSLNPNGGVGITNLWANPQFRRVPGATTEQLSAVGDQVPRARRGDQVTSWAVVVHGGRQVFMGRYASGRSLVRDMGPSSKPSGTLISSSEDVGAAAPGEPEQAEVEAAGAGQEAEGSGEDEQRGPTMRKSTANYKPKASAYNCGDCNMFRQGGHCTLVIGKINPGGTCDYFERARKKMGAGVEVISSGASDEEGEAFQPQPGDLLSPDTIDRIIGQDPYPQRPPEYWRDVHNRTLAEQRAASQAADPGQSSDSPAYFERQSLEAAGWDPDAIRWAQANVPLDYPTQQGMPWGGAYWPGRPGRIEVPITPGEAGGRSAQDVQSATSHELQHAWELNRQPRLGDQDWLRLLEEEPDIRHAFEEAYAGDYTRLHGVGWQDDPAHRIHMLLAFGFKPQDMPQWFQDKYLTEFGAGQDDDTTDVDQAAINQRALEDLRRGERQAAYTDILQTPGLGYTVPTAADVTNIEQRQREAAIEQQRREERLTPYTEILQTPGYGYQVPTAAQVINQQRAAAPPTVAAADVSELAPDWTTAPSLLPPERKPIQAPLPGVRKPISQPMLPAPGEPPAAITPAAPLKPIEWWEQASPDERKGMLWDTLQNAAQLAARAAPYLVPQSALQTVAPGVQAVYANALQNGIDPAPAVERLLHVEPGSATETVVKRALAGQQMSPGEAVSAAFELLDRANTFRADLSRAAQPPEIRGTPEGETAAQAVAATLDPLNLLGLEAGPGRKLLAEGIEDLTPRVAPQVARSLGLTRLDPLTSLPAAVRELPDLARRVLGRVEPAQAEANFATGGIAGGIARLITGSTAAEELAPRFARPGELGRLPFDELPNRDILRRAPGVEARPSGDGGGYFISERAPATAETAGLRQGDPGRVRQTIADLVPNPRVPFSTLRNDLMERFLETRAAMRSRIAAGGIQPESLVPPDLGAMGSIGRGATDFTKAYTGLGEEGVQRLRPTFQTQVGPGAATTRGLVWRPEISWATTASDTTNPHIMGMLTAIARPSVEEGAPLAEASFRTVAERQAAIDAGLRELVAQQAQFGHGRLMSTADLIAGRQLMREGMAVGKGGGGWSETWPAKWRVLQDWAAERGTFSGLEPRAATDRLLEQLEAPSASLRGLGQVKTRFAAAMSVDPSFATLDTRILRDIFGLHPKTELTPAEYRVLEQKLAATPSATQYLYGKQWLPWEFLSGETTDYTSLGHSVERVNTLAQQAVEDARANRTTVGEAMQKLATQQRQVELAYPEANPQVLARIGISPDTWTSNWTDRFKDLPLGMRGGALEKQIPELKRFAEQAGIQVVGKPTVAAGGWLSDATGQMYREGALDLQVRGPLSNVRFFSAAMLAGYPNEEAAMVLYHSGVPLDGQLATISISNVHPDEVSGIEALATQHHPEGWTVRAISNKGDLQLLIAAGKDDVPNFNTLVGQLTSDLEKRGAELSSTTIDPAALEFIDRSQIKDIIYGGPRGAYRPEGPGRGLEAPRGGGLADLGARPADTGARGAAPGAVGPGAGEYPVRLEEGARAAGPPQRTAPAAAANSVLAPDEREAAIRANLPPTVRDTIEGEAITRQVSAAADPLPYLEQLRQSGRDQVLDALVDRTTLEGRPIDELPRAQTYAPHTATQQADMLQHAALELNDNQLLVDSRAAMAAAKHEPLSPEQLHQAIADAVRRTNPTFSTAEVAQRVNQVLRSAARTRAPGAASAEYALRLAGGALGAAATGGLAYQRTDPNDPMRMWKVGLAAAGGGVVGIGLPYLAGFLSKSNGPRAMHFANRVFAPTRNLSPELQRLSNRFTGGFAAATTRGNLFQQGIHAVFRPDEFDDAFAAYVEEHAALPPEWAGHPRAEAFLQDWKEIGQWAPKYVDLERPINFADPANPAKLYWPHIVDKDWKAAIQKRPLSNSSRASGYSGLSQNPFYVYKQPRTYQSMNQGMAMTAHLPEPIRYTKDQARALGMYVAKAYQEKEVADYAKAVRALAKTGTDPDVWVAQKGVREQAGKDLGAYHRRLQGLRGSDEYVGALKTWFGSTEPDNPLAEVGEKVLSGAAIAKHEMLGLSGFHGINVTQQLYRALPGAYAQRGLLGSTSLPAKAARYAFEVLPPVHIARFATEMKLASERTVTREQWARFWGDGDASKLLDLAHVMTPGHARGFAAANGPEMLEAIGNGLVLNMNTSKQLGLKTRVAVSLLLAGGGGKSGYELGQSWGLSPEQSLALGLGFAAAGAAVPHVPWSLSRLGPLGIPTPFRGQLDLVGNLNEMLFGRYIPYMKFRTYQLYKPAFGGQAAAEFANQVHGGENLVATARSRTVQNLLRTFMLAPDWQINWGKQIGHALFDWHGPLGEMNRLYWLTTAISGAFLLEASNLAFGGHWSWENDPSAALMTDASKFYDMMDAAQKRGVPIPGDWRHVQDGVSYRPYWDTMGTIRGLLEPMVEIGRASALNVMEAYGIEPPPEIAGDVRRGIPHPDPVDALKRFGAARSGILPRNAFEQLAGVSYTGDPIDVAGDPAVLNAGRRVIHALQGVLPIGPGAAVAGELRGDPGIVSLLAGATGIRTKRISSSSLRLQAFDQWLRDNGLTPQAQRFLQDARTYRNQHVTYEVQDILNDPNLTPQTPPGQARGSSMMDRINRVQDERESEYQQLLEQLGIRYGGYDPASGLPPPPGFEQKRDELSWLTGGIIQAGTNAPADLPPRTDISPDQLWSMAWTPRAQTGVPQKLLADVGISAPDWLPKWGALDEKDTKAMSKAHMAQVQQVATQWNIDPAVMEDLMKAHLYGDGQLPPLPGMTSAGLDQLTTQYRTLSHMDPGPERSAAQRKLIQDAAAAHNVDPDALRQRIIWRNQPMQEEPSVLRSDANADNLELRVAAYKFTNANGSAWGTIDQERLASNLLQQARRENRYDPPARGSGLAGTYYRNADKSEPDPKLQAAADAEQRGKTDRNKQLQAAGKANYTDWDRKYGRGKYLTNAQWQQFQEGTLKGTFDDIGDQHPKEFQWRIKILDRWAELSPEQRMDPDQPATIPLLMQDVFTGELSQQKVTMAEAAYYLTHGGKYPSPGRLHSIVNLGTDPNLVE